MIPLQEWSREGYTVSNDPARIQLDIVHGFLSSSYWAQGISRDLVARSIAGSIPFGIYAGAGQVGFARVISDCATFAYLADVFVLEAHRKRGLARWMMECIMSTPELQRLRRWLLVTSDAHALYRGLGFAQVERPEGFMEINIRDIYSSDKTGAER